MYIIGINSYHPDSSACIIKDGKLISAVEEERLTRIKHWSGFPTLSIKHCLKEANIKLSDVSYISINRDPKANLFKKFLHVLRYKPSLNLILDRLKFKKKYQTLNVIFEKEFLKDKFHGEIINIEHHEAHLSSAFNVSDKIAYVVDQGKKRTGKVLWKEMSKDFSFKKSSIGKRTPST